jgi:hypothetical protein
MLTAILQAVLSVFASIWKWKQDKKEETSRTLGKAEQSNVDLQGRIDALQKANQLREEAESRIMRNGRGGV